VAHDAGGGVTVHGLRHLVLCQALSWNEYDRLIIGDFLQYAARVQAHAEANGERLSLELIVAAYTPTTE
jgi:hypothetical protein